MSEPETFHRISNGQKNTWLGAIKRSPLLRLLLLVFFVLLLQIPVTMIGSVIAEREERRTEAVDEVTQKWGRQQEILGPMVKVPYLSRWEEVDQNGRKVERSEVRYATFLPEVLEVDAKIEAQERYRGIFRVPVYRLAMEARGHFLQPDFAEWGIPQEHIFWNRAHLAVLISDAHSITRQAVLSWGRAPLPFAPSPGESLKGSGIHVPLKGHLQGSKYTYSFRLELNGSLGVYFAPLGKKTTVHLRSNWPDPSFQGTWLPRERRVGPTGMEAVWSIPSLGRNLPQRYLSLDGEEQQLREARLGAALLSPVDPYRMAERSVKYSILFLALTFITLWLFEVLGRLKIHTIQYLLLGSGMCLFYLLELALSEHLGFGGAYLLASALVVGMVSIYSAAVLERRRRAVILGAVVTALFGYLFVLLVNQDYSLLIGAIGLFCVLAAIMFLTRRTDWSNLWGPAQ